MSDGLEVFIARLGGGDVAAVCDAFRDFKSAQADARWGVDNPYMPVADRVRLAAETRE
jgi:hypothetical protein